MKSNAADDPEIAYFRDIERAFVERRGDPLFISNADWVFLASLWKRRVPLRVVLRGLTDAFDAHAHSFARRQKIRSLKFCEDQITAAVDRYRRALQAEGPGPRRRSAAIEMLAERVSAVSTPPEIAEAVAAARLGLQVVVESAGQDKTFNADQALAQIEDRLVGNVSSALAPGALAAMDKAARDLTAAYRSRMPAKVYETLIGESVRRKILQQFGLPRFLLAEIE